MLAFAVSSHDFTATLASEGYLCLEGFAPRQHPERDDFLDSARFDRIPVAEHRVVSCNIAVRLVMLQSQQLLAQHRVAPQHSSLLAGRLWQDSRH
jgi:hypothetical protein